MKVGGSTTSLLSLLDCISKDERYEIDLLLRENVGPYMDKIPKDVNLLPPAYIGDKKKLKYRKMLSFKSLFVLARAFVKKIIFKKAYEASQIVELDTVRYCRREDKKYDIAISYLEQWPLYYTAEIVSADRYITWIHTDYEKAGLSRNIDMPFLSKMDTIVTVSEECAESVRRVFPELAEKVVFIENMISSRLVRALAKEACDFRVKRNVINFVTVARLDLKSKAFDRTILQFEKMTSGEHFTEWHWYIVGDGPHRTRIEKIIKDKHLENQISLLGQKINPYPYEIECDYFLLASYFEGKPVSVEEAKILGVVPIITAYDSARSQVKNGTTGYICDNSDEGVYKGLVKAIREISQIHYLKENLKNEYFQNFEEKNKIFQLLEDDKYHERYS